MIVEQLTLKNFRNIETCSFFPDQKVNFLIGENGQGKTSCIEAISFLSTLRSFRSAKVSAVIRNGCSKSEIVSAIRSSDLKAELKINFEFVNIAQQKTKKIAFVNGKAFRSSTQYLSQRFGSFELGFHSVIFNPSDHDLVRGEPSLRRSYLDKVLTAENINYLKVLQRYQRSLDQRNAFLKSPHSRLGQGIDEFTESLSKYGSYIVHQRLLWLERLSHHLQPAIKKIAPEQADLKVVYLSHWLPEIQNLSFNSSNLSPNYTPGRPVVPSVQVIEQLFLEKLRSHEAIEHRMGYTLVGPHRDDWSFLLGDNFLKGHGSQGEVRSALIALKLCEIHLFRMETGHRPLFLLDDFSSELDRKRRLFLLQFLSETELQTFVTTTEDSSFVGKRYRVINGVIKPHGER